MIDTAIRLLSAGQLLLVALVVARGTAPMRIRWATVALLGCVGAYLAVTAPELRLRLAFWAVLQLPSLATPLALWVFAHMIFERRIDLRLAGVAAAVTLVCWGLFVYARYITHRFPVSADAAQQLVALLLALHAIGIALARRGDDLIEKRRAFRSGFALLVGLQTVGMIVGETWYGYDSLTLLMVIQSSATFIAVMGFGMVMLSSNAEQWFETKPPPDARTADMPSEHVLRLKLEAAMQGRIYREAGLSIGVLATRLGTNEHRLRTLINQRLGYRNFSDFLDTHRIADARRWLSDPEQMDLPLLTIAMDLGYGSLAPFNRAFFEATGQTPLEYRRAAILDTEDNGRD